MSDINTDILCRLERLEKQNRRLRRGLIGMVLGIFVLCTVAWTAASEYYDYQGQFFLRDKFGNMRGGISCGAESNLGFLWLGGVAENTGNGEFRRKDDIAIGYDTKGEPNIWIYDKYGKVKWSAIK